MSKYDAVAQDRTLPTADHWGEGWTSYELDFLREFSADETAEEIARTLGRTLYAVRAMQHAMRGGRSHEGRNRRRTVRLPFDQGFTDLRVWEEMFE